LLDLAEAGDLVGFGHVEAEQSLAAIAGDAEAAEVEEGGADVGVVYAGGSDFCVD